MYLINDGVCKVHIWAKDPEKKGNKYEDITVKMLKRGDHFGEVSLIHDSHRTASITA